MLNLGIPISKEQGRSLSSGDNSSRERPFSDEGSFYSNDESEYISENNNNQLAVSQGMNEGNLSNRRISLDRSGKQVDYSADIEPLKFRMRRTPDLQITSNQEQKQQSDLSTPVLAPGNAVTRKSIMLPPVEPNLHTISVSKPIFGSNNTTSSWNFNFIDKEQFEEYLKEPNYIKIYKRHEDINQFKRLFLAQELKITDPNANIINKNITNNNLLYTETNNTFLNKDQTGPSPSSSSFSSEPNGNANLDASDKAIWSTKFSHDGKFMATGSKDGILRIWKVINSPMERLELDCYQESNLTARSKSLRIRDKMEKESPLRHSMDAYINKKYPNMAVDESNESLNLYAPVFNPSPFKIFKEHTADILDMDWSKNGFILTSSMDKKAKLWHPNRETSLQTFSHPDFVTSVKFHPVDDRFFLTGCLDHKCRFWSILENSVVYEFNCYDLITSLTLSPGEGEFTIVGTFNGYIHILLTTGLKHVSTFHITEKHFQNSNNVNSFHDFKSLMNKKRGPRVTGFQCFYPPSSDSTAGSKIDKNLRILVSANDSRLRIFDLDQNKLLEVLKGYRSGLSQHNGQLLRWGNEHIVINSSNDHWFYAWRLKSSKLSEKGSVTTNNDKNKSSKNKNTKNNLKHSLIPRKISNFLSSHKDQPIKNSHYVAFHAHHEPVTTATIAPPETAKTLALSNDFICELSLQYMKNQQQELGKRSLKSESSTTNTTISSRKSSDLTSQCKNSIPRKPHSSSTTHESLPSVTSSRPTTATGVPNVVDIVGPILVTTDSEGNIRVFRTDLGRQVREKVLESLHLEKKRERESIHKPAIDSSLTLTNMNQPDVSSKCTSSNVIVAPSLNPLIKVISAGDSEPNLRPLTKDTATSNNSKGVRRASTGGSTRPNLLNINSTINGSMNSLNSSLRQRMPSISSSIGSESARSNLQRSNDLVAGNSVQFKCEVCEGRRFEPISNKLGQRENGYYCLDCGNILNNFR
ncbi:Dgr2p NDAI_0K01410 [Naumovozyma dairenensis CBS 421]|uniref:Uncharacterized protein n=1 Tax=Naumovozyma dairenensis (strain ATCC 10597 / BCRC 20456 / CBS 421 / NBRC 0211 / NRRL Y-12639) TaxID=1071378 RepID=G0WHS1_NAUDC|nr:hypothetical protein NDAI_0K01410 [Naumovozyma dairenensis CBS 421]CCD27332.1 hypothetical protein NDAI_0K01410 [Naumovozyma dairenensis CBS 421]